MTVSNVSGTPGRASDTEIATQHESPTPAPDVEEYEVDPRPRWRRLLGPTSLLAGIALGTLYIARVDPNQPGHYPPCPWKLVTGLDCPGCGGLRATHALAHGDILGALDHNALFVLMLPVIAFFLGRALLRAWTGRRPVPTERTKLWSKRTNLVLVITLVAFTVLRNIPLFWYFNSTS